MNLQDKIVKRIAQGTALGIGCGWEPNNTFLEDAANDVIALVQGKPVAKRWRHESSPDMAWIYCELDQKIDSDGIFVDVELLYGGNDEG